jgi:4-carboxymuconolactone decarboxylase
MFVSNPELRARGVALFEQLFGGEVMAAAKRDLEEICPDFIDMTLEWAVGGLTARPGLDLATRELVVIASCVTLGHTVVQLRAHTQAALKAGATKEQIVEAMLQLQFYAGGAAVRNALANVKDILLAAT